MTQSLNSPLRPKPASPHSAAEVQASRLHWLIRLRWLYIVGVSSLAAAVSLWQPQGLATYLLAAAAGLMLVYNIVFTVLINRAARRPGSETLA